MNRALSKEEEQRCLKFLKLMGIDHPDHRFLSKRGFFALFLSGLQQQKSLPGDPAHQKEYRQTIRLLTIAGLERIKELLEEDRKGMDQRKVSAIDLKKPSSELSSPQSHNRRKFKKDISYIRPKPEEYEHYKKLEHAQNREEAIALARRYTSEGKLHDAYHIMVDYLLRHPLSEESFQAATNIILKASSFNREKGIPPENMLYECEEMAAVLHKRIPDMSHLSDKHDEVSTKLLHFIKLVYQTWTTHCAALLEYKYRLNNTEWVQRNWIEPRDFGFLVEVMRIAVASKVSLDLLRIIYGEIRKCIDIGNHVIAHEEKRAKFEGDVLRIIASPTKDVVPDMCFQIYKDIVAAYQREGDVQNALIFCKQALMIRANDRNLLDIRARLESGGVMPRRS